MKYRALGAEVTGKNACKRMYLNLRWMVRCEAFDPGGWQEIPDSKLIILLDVNMKHIGSRLMLTKR